MIEKMTFQDKDIRPCEICDNHTWHNYCAECGEPVCSICHTTYGCPELD